MASMRWVLLSSRLPREPSRLRLGIWRRLRRLGAVLLHDALWVLPAEARTREAFDWLAEEIGERGGTAFVWEAASLDGPQDRELVRHFRADADGRYAALAASARALVRAARLEPRTARRRLVGLERGLRLERRRDYFHAAGRGEAETALAAAIAGLAAPARAHPAGDDDALDHAAASAY